VDTPATVAATPPETTASTIGTGNTPLKGADAKRWAAVNGKTGAMYNNDTIGPGSKDFPPDTRVADLQKKLGINPTGVYGSTEKKAVEELQKKLGITVDGKYGPDTKAAHEKEKPTYVSPNPADASASSGVASSGVASSGSTTGKVPPQPTLNGKPSTGPKGQEWLAKYGATHNPDGTPKSATGVVNTQPSSGVASSVTQVSAANQNQAGTKATYKPDEIAAAKEAIADHNSGKAKLSARDLDFYTKIVANSTQTSGQSAIDPKTTITVNGVVRPVNPNDIKSIQSWIDAVKDKRKKMEEVPPVYLDIVKKQLSTKESYESNGQVVYQEDQTLARIIQLSRF